MGKFDSIQVDNLFENTQHNAISYQTKELECNLQEYLIKDKQLYHVTPKNLGQEEAILTRICEDTVFNMYGTLDDKWGTLIVQYHLSLVEGKVTTVDLVDQHYIRYKDIGHNLNILPSVTSLQIDAIQYTGEQAERFSNENLKETLTAIREAVGDPKLTVILRRPQDRRWLHYVVQDWEDINKVIRSRHINLPDRMTIQPENEERPNMPVAFFIDEYSEVASK